MTYTKRVDNKSAFTNQVFKIFTDACGGDPSVFSDILYQKYTVEDLSLSDDYNYFTIFEMKIKLINLKNILNYFTEHKEC